MYISQLLYLFLSLLVLLHFLSFASSKKCSCMHKTSEKSKSVEIYSWADNPNPVELKLVTHILSFNECGVTVDLATTNQICWK